MPLHLLPIEYFSFLVVSNALRAFQYFIILMLSLDIVGLETRIVVPVGAMEVLGRFCYICWVVGRRPSSLHPAANFAACRRYAETTGVIRSGRLDAVNGGPFIRS